MVFPRMRAFVTGLLFVGWIGFLAYLVVQTRGRVIVARPQIQRSNLIVVAELTDAGGRPDATVKIKSVLFSADEAGRGLAGKTLELDELLFVSAKQGWQGAGDYVVPITRPAKGPDRVTLLPITPGYYPAASTMIVDVGEKPHAVAKLIASATGAPLRRLEEMFQVPNVVIENVALSPKALSELSSAIKSAGGEVKSVEPAEFRIYPATNDVRLQIQAIVR